MAFARFPSDMVFNTTFLGKSDDKYRIMAEQYLKEKLGEAYYSEFVTFSSANSWKDCGENNCTIVNVIRFDYKKTKGFEVEVDEIVRLKETTRIYENGTLIETRFDDGRYTQDFFGQIKVEVDTEGNVVKYSGPSKPHQFLLSESQAIQVAEEYGLENITDAKKVGIPSKDGYIFVWAVDSKEIFSCEKVLIFEHGSQNMCFSRGIYIDVDTGNILGEYESYGYTTLDNAEQIDLRRYRKLGEFLSESNVSPEQFLKSEPISQTWKINLPAIFLIIFIAAIAALIFKKIRK